MAETEETADVERTSSVGERLRSAREEKGMALEDIAEQTRIPRRHLEAIEGGDWDRLPAATYTIGFAKSYASAVGLDRNEVAEDVRAEIGSPRPTPTTEVFEPVDPARTMPRWLVLGAIGAIILVVVILGWLNRQALEPDEAPVATVSAPAAAPAQSPGAEAPPAPAPAAQGPVVLTATAPAWIQVRDQGRVLFEGMLNPGQSYEVPATATAPVLRAGAPEALRVTVGGQVAPPVGPPGRVASNVSLLGPDLMRGPSPAAGTATPAANATE